MKKTLKFIGVSVLALAFAHGGHGAATVAAQDGAPGIAFAPAMRNDAAFALCVTLDKAHVLGVVDAILGKLDSMFGADNGQIAKIKALVESYKADPFKDAPPDVRSFVNESGLNEVRLQWIVVSCESISISDDDASKPQGISLAVAGSIDFEKFMKALHARCAKDPDSDTKIMETAAAGVKAFRFVPKDAATVKKMKDRGGDSLYVASLDRRLVIVAQTLDILAKQIRLFRDGEARDSALDGFLPARGSVVSLALTDLGNLVQKKQKNVNFDARLPNGNAIISGMKLCVIDLQATPAGALGLSWRVQAASEKHADTLRTLVKTGLMMGRAQLAQAPDKPVSVIRLLEAVKVGGANGAVELSINTTISDVVAAIKQFMETKARNDKEAKAQDFWFEANAYFKGTNGHPKDWAKARELYLKAGMMFSTPASGGRLAQLGTFFDLKQGPFDRDYAEAAKWYRKGADLGNHWCMGKLSVLYREGRGVEKSITNALHYAKMAAEEGLGHYLAEYYERGIGVERDLTKAFELRRKEAEWLNPGWDRGGPAFKVGQLYERGIGTPTNTVEAIRWYKKSKKQGNKKAEKRLRDLEAMNQNNH